MLLTTPFDPVDFALMNVPRDGFQHVAVVLRARCGNPRLLLRNVSRDRDEIPLIIEVPAADACSRLHPDFRLFGRLDVVEALRLLGGVSEDRRGVVPAMQHVAVVGGTASRGQLVVPVRDADQVARAGALAVLAEPAVVAADGAADVGHVPLVEIRRAVAHLLSAIGDASFGHIIITVETETKRETQSERDR